MTARSRHTWWAPAATLVIVHAACTAEVGIDTDRGAPADPSATDPSATDPSATDPAPAESTITEPDPAVVAGEFDNGMEYFIRANDNPGARVEMRLAVDAGSAIQDDDQGGQAHFLEHMLFNGTEMFPGNDLIDVLRSFGSAFGADINASTSYDETIYKLTMATDDLAIVETGLDVLEQWLTSATIDPDEVVAEQGIVLDEWRGSQQSSSGRIFNEVGELFLAGSPYEDRIPIGTDEEIQSTEDDTLRRYYDDWYRPDNVAVVVVGDIDPAWVEDQLEERFEPATDRSAGRERPVFEMSPSTEPQARVLADPDVAKGFAFVNLPLSRSAGSPDEVFEQQLLSDLAFEIIANRLSDDARRGEVPFDSARVDSSSFVRDLDAPEIVVEGDAASLGPGLQAIVDEFERVARFGLGEGETERAISAARRDARTAYDGRDTRQDASYADEYVRHFLTDEPIPTAEAWFAFTSDVFDRATPESITAAFTARHEVAGPHALSVAPQSQVDDAPTVDEVIRIISTAADRDLEPRDEDVALPDVLMEPPEAAEVEAVDSLGSGYVEPVVLEFANGVQVGLTVTPVVEGVVTLEARSPGGLDAVDDEYLPDAQAASQVVAESGAGAFGPVELEAFLADKDVGLTPFIEQNFEGFNGGSASGDLETLFQLLHLTMTAPQVDPVALDRYVTDTTNLAADPSVDPSYAGFDALLRTRYPDNPGRWLPTVDSVARVDADGVETVFLQRFGDATDFAFSLAGDFDVDEARQLAARYLGTLPGAGRVEEPSYDEPEPPAGVVVDEVNAGEGERASVSILHTNEARNDRREEVTAQLASTAITNRLIDSIREEVGESYSPFGVIEFTDGPAPNAETFVSVSTSPDLLDDVTGAVIGELADLEGEGVSDAEFDAASETVRRELELFSNPQVNDEVLRALLDPAGNESFQEFYTLAGLAADIEKSEVDSALDRWLDEERFIQVDVLPR